MPQPLLLSWSGGKDSALALQELNATGAREVKALLTTVTAEFYRISMHGVRRRLLQEQASSLGLPLEEVWIPSNSSNEVYETEMRKALMKCRDQGVEEDAFGDLRAKRLVALWALEEVHHFPQFGFCFIAAGHILEGNTGRLVGDEFSRALAEPEDRLTGGAELASHQRKQAYRNEEGQPPT